MPRSRKQKHQLADEASQLKQLAQLEKTPQFQLLLPLAQDPSSTVSAALSTHSALTTLTIASAKKEGKTSTSSEVDLLGDHPYDTWSAIFELVGRTPPAQQSKLVGFILGLRKMEVKDRDESTGKEEVLKYYDMEFWRQLPGFAWQARETFNLDTISRTLTSNEKIVYENQNAFLAQLLSTCKIPLTPTPSTTSQPCESATLDFSLFALWVFRDAFENAPTGRTKGAKPDEKKNDLSIRASCHWLLFAAENLWSNVVNERSMPEKAGMGGSLYEEKGWKGFEKERWDVWRKGFRNADVGKETQLLIADALKCMGRVMGDKS